MTGVILTFNAAVTSLIVSVPIINDTIAEPDQYFFGNLRNPVGPGDLNPDQAMVTIVDDGDRKYHV